MDQNYLLTYTDCGKDKFAWFETEEEMRDFVKKYRVTPIEAFFIKDAEEVEF